MDEFLGVGFNQDNGCFSVGESKGLRIFNTDPYGEQFRRHFDGPDSGIAIVEMLFRCNIFALVGGGTHPRFPCNKVMIWDDHQGRCIGELTFRNTVRAVKLRRDRIAVALDHKVLLYNFADLRLITQYDTIHNPKGLLAMSSMVDSTVLACPGVHGGQVRVERSDTRQTKFVDAHTNALAAIAVSLDGTRLVTASERGTLVRIFETFGLHQLQEVRRGSDPAEIYSLALDRQCNWLAVSSDKNTVHVFAMSEAVQNRTVHAVGKDALGGDDPGGPARANPSSWFNMAKGIVPLPTYFASEWSFAQFKIPEDSRASVGFGESNGVADTLFVITRSGSFYKLRLNTKSGGVMQQEQYECFADRSGAGSARQPV